MQSWFIWRLAIVRCGINCFVVGGTVYITSMSGISWSGLSSDDKFLVILGVLIAIGTNIQSFLDRTIENQPRKKSDFNGGYTTIRESENMSFALCYWILMLIWLVFGLWTTGWRNLKQNGGNLVLFILLLLLGWTVFGSPLHK